MTARHGTPRQLLAGAHEVRAWPTYWAATCRLIYQLAFSLPTEPSETGRLRRSATPRCW